MTQFSSHGRCSTARSRSRGDAAAFLLATLLVACSSRTTVTGGGGSGGEGGAAGANATGGATTGGAQAAGGATENGGATTAGEGGTQPTGGTAGETSTSNGGAGAQSGAGNEAGAAGLDNSAGAGMGGQGLADCTADELCVARAAPGWSGPVAVAAAAAAPDCPAEFPASAFDAGSGVDAPSAQCSCQCGELSGSCPATVGFSNYSSTDCSGTPVEVVDDLAPSTCQAYTSGRFEIAAPSTSCEPLGTVVPNVPAPSFSERVRGCSGATLGGTCDNSGICVPEPPAPFDELCVYRDGEHECPTGYVVGSLVYQNLDDTRACPATCNCSPVGGVCELGVNIYNGPSGSSMCGDLAGSRTVSSDEPNCIATGNRVAYFSAPTFNEGSGQCSGADPSPTGSVTAVEPITVCCVD